MAVCWFLIFFFMTSAVCRESRPTVCGTSDDLRVSLTCRSTEWIHVLREVYSAPPSGSCAVTGDCQHVLSSNNAGLNVSCNGPVGDTGECQEETDSWNLLKGCANGSDYAAVQVRYKCLQGTDMFNMCNNGTRTWTAFFDDPQIFAYLTTPEFPHTPARSQQCTCQVTGQDIWILGLEIQLDVDTYPPWSEGVTVSVNGSTLWSPDPVTGRVSYLQESMLIPNPGDDSTEAFISYRDNNQPGQVAWMRIQGTGDNLTITCESVEVPPPPPKTTTTTTATTTTTTTTTTPAPTTTTTTPSTTTPTPTTITLPPTLPATTTTTTVIAPSPTTTTAATTTQTSTKVTSPSGTSTAVAGGNQHKMTTKSGKDASARQSKTDDDDGGDAGVIVGLTILAIVLIAVAAGLGFVIWRRYQQAKKEGIVPPSDRRGPGAFLGLRYWYNRFRNRHNNDGDHEPSFVDIPVHDFHNIEGFDHHPAHHTNPSDIGQYETVGELDLRPKQVPNSANSKDEAERTGAEHVYDHLYTENVHSSSAEKSSTEPEKVPHSEPGAQSLSSNNHGLYEEVDIKKDRVSPSAGEGDKGLSNKKEKFVAKVLDQTLESIISQREALAASLQSQINEGTHAQHQSPELSSDKDIYSKIEQFASPLINTSVSSSDKPSKKQMPTGKNSLLDPKLQNSADEAGRLDSTVQDVSKKRVPGSGFNSVGNKKPNEDKSIDFVTAEKPEAKDISETSTLESAC